MTKTVRTFPPSFAKDTKQALHELWVAATNFDNAMTEEGFREAIEAIEVSSYVRGGVDATMDLEE